ncbi:MAG: EboA domain-containing protein [Betaproteobacteria bacterium]|nr:EboA domain-containing protein [Betaproteobacteria bacterium]
MSASGPAAPTDTELQAAAATRPGWNPSDWTLDQAARSYLICASTSDGAQTSQRLDRLCSAADVGELVAFYRGLPLYPDQPRYVLRAAEGVRSNMRVVFEAVAHRNPYPAEQFAEAAWNQLVLKALFVGSQLAPIVGLDARRNATLARMLCDYAHERWAASRPVSPELWRCVGPFAAGPVLEDFARLFERGTADEQLAAALALREATDPEAARLSVLHAPAARDGCDLNQLWERLAAAGT